MNSSKRKSPGKTNHAIKAVRHGASDAAEAATQVSEKIRGLLSQTVYGAFYGVSYGVVFGALLIAKAIPAGSAIEKGILDGAHAAKADAGKQGGEAGAGWQEAGGLAA